MQYIRILNFVKEITLEWKEQTQFILKRVPPDPQIYKPIADWKGYWATNMSHFLYKNELKEQIKTWENGTNIYRKTLQWSWEL